MVVGKLHYQKKNYFQTKPAKNKASLINNYYLFIYGVSLLPSSFLFGNIGPVGAKNLSLDFQELVDKYQLEIQGLIHIGAHYGQEYEIYQKLNIVNLVFFEPLSENFEILKSHVGENVRLFQIRRL
ncbi:hypothetical protein [Hydrocoleum sp. CS-953]|uniref:hypothetical protein n=1 Tax=Microcoleaceae TaxID=1892252 RepID=UPI00117AA7A0|nr:hypothetical protein [Hydrocoleum sp. CS-953]